MNPLLCASLKSDIKRRAAYSRINLERAVEDHVSQRQARTPEALRHFLDAVAQFIEQGKKAILFVDLSAIVGAPFLLVSFLDGDSFSVGLSLAVVGVLTLNDYLDSINVFAAEVSGGEVWASAVRMRRVRFNDITVTVLRNFSRLRRNKPSSVISSFQFCFRGDYESALFSFLLFVHCCAPIGETQHEAYNFGCLDPFGFGCAWLNAEARVRAFALAARLAEGVRFELTDGAVTPSLDLQSSGLNHSPSPPLIKPISSILLLARSRFDTSRPVFLF